MIFLVLWMFFHCFMYKLYINIYINSVLWLPEHGYCTTVDPSPVFFLHSLPVCLALDWTRWWCVWPAPVLHSCLTTPHHGGHAQTHFPVLTPSSLCDARRDWLKKESQFLLEAGTKVRVTWCLSFRLYEVICWFVCGCLLFMIHVQNCLSAQ